MPHKKIMIVDDDKEFLEELCETLVLSGYEALIVNDPAEVFSKAARIKPDMIILDLKMKGITGFEVANKLKNNNETMEIPIIAMSGFFNTKEDDTLFNFFDIRYYLHKPFNPLDIIAKIESVFKEGGKSGYRC